MQRFCVDVRPRVEEFGVRDVELDDLVEHELLWPCLVVLGVVLESLVWPRGAGKRICAI